MTAPERYGLGWTATTMDAAGMARSGACRLLTGPLGVQEV
jgi:hypothetical protein